MTEKSFSAQYNRLPVAREDFDPDNLCQDEYEFLTGTGDYSDNAADFETPERKANLLQFLLEYDHGVKTYTICPCVMGHEMTFHSNVLTVEQVTKLITDEITNKTSEFIVGKVGDEFTVVFIWEHLPYI